MKIVPSNTLKQKFGNVENKPDKEIVVAKEDLPDHLLFYGGKWRFKPSAKMIERGFLFLTFGRVLTKAAIDKANSINAEWEAILTDSAIKAMKTGNDRTLRCGYQQVFGLRQTERQRAGLAPDGPYNDWPRFWSFIGPKFGHRDPSSITPIELLDYRAEIEDRVGARDAYTTIKTWRALWKRMGTIICADGQPLVITQADPSKAWNYGNPQPRGRTQTWLAKEVQTFVGEAWRLGYCGLAAAIATSWDTQFSPIDVCSLTAAHTRPDGPNGFYFFQPRAKTNAPAIGTLISQWTVDGQQIGTAELIRRHIQDLGITLLPSTPLFWTRGNVPIGRPGEPGEHGGDHGGGAIIEPRPYRRETLGAQFRDVRILLFGKDEKRQLRDFRRTGTVEAFAGGARPEQVQEKMANTIGYSNALFKTYNPVNREKVRAADEARLRGRERLAVAAVADISGVDLLRS